VKRSQGGRYEALPEESLRAFVGAVLARESFGRDWRTMKEQCSELNQRKAEIDKYFSERLISPKDSAA
jgi:hypothetical protein